MIVIAANTTDKNTPDPTDLPSKTHVSKSDAIQLTYIWLSLQANSVFRYQTPGTSKECSLVVRVLSNCNLETAHQTSKDDKSPPPKQYKLAPSQSIQDIPPRFLGLFEGGHGDCDAGRLKRHPRARSLEQPRHPPRAVAPPQGVDHAGVRDGSGGR